MSPETEVPACEVRAPWRMLRRGTTKVAFSLNELVTLTSDFSLKYAQGCNSTVIRTDPAKFLFVYRVVCHKKDKNGKDVSDPNGHVVRMKFDFSRLKETGTVDDLDVRLSCSCPAWLYWGGQWNTATGDALYGAPRPKFQPPTDPQRYSNILCKHVKVVADRIGPVLERVLSSHRNKKDRATQEQNLKDIELEKQRTQQEVEELSAQPNVPVPDTTPQSPTAPALDDNDLGDLTLPSQRHAPPKPNPENLLPESLRKLLKLPTAPGQKPPTPDEAPEPTPEPAPAPEPPKAGPLGAQVVKDKSPGRQVTPNLTVYDDEDDTATVLPGSMGALVKKDKATKPPTPPKPAPIVRDKDTEGRKLPPNIKLIDDDDDSTIKINSSLHRMMASLVLADEEAPAAGPLGALLLSTRKTPITGSLAALVIASRATSTPIA